MKDRKLVIDLTDASENMFFWLISLLDNEVDEAIGAAANEAVFARGSDNDDSRLQHLLNCDEQLVYAAILKKASLDVNLMFALGDNNETEQCTDKE